MEIFNQSNVRCHGNQKRDHLPYTCMHLSWYSYERLHIHIHGNEVKMSNITHLAIQYSISKYLSRAAFFL
jgi:hypothetical protein